MILDRQEYAVYNGDEFYCIGTKIDIIEKLNITENTFYYYCSKWYQKKIKKDLNRIRIIRINMSNNEILRENIYNIRNDISTLHSFKDIFILYKGPYYIGLGTKDQLLKLADTTLDNLKNWSSSSYKRKVKKNSKQTYIVPLIHELKHLKIYYK